MNSDGMQGKIGSIYTYCSFDLIYTILEKKAAKYYNVVCVREEKYKGRKKRGGAQYITSYYTIYLWVTFIVGFFSQLILQFLLRQIGKSLE